jgi:hypothetical protein
MPPVTSSTSAANNERSSMTSTSTGSTIHSNGTNGVSNNDNVAYAGNGVPNRPDQTAPTIIVMGTALNHSNATTAPLANATNLTAATNSTLAAGSAKYSSGLPKPQPVTVKHLTLAEKDARQNAWREAASEDEKRMRFLALLCGRGSLQESNTNLSLLRNRERSSSVGGMGEDNGSSRMDMDLDQEAADPTGKTLPGNAGSKPLTESTDPSQPLPPNYDPTTPQNLSRRILHKQGVGFLDDAVSLLLSAASDRFLATVLTQATACRDRRLEGYKALLVERKARKRHRRKVLKERIERERRCKEEIDKKRKEADEVIKEHEEGKKAKAPSLATGTGAAASTATEALSFSIKKADIDRMNEFRTDNAEMDAEEDYYHSCFGNKGDDDNAGEKDTLDEENEEESDDDDDSDDEIDDKQYDLLLRDIVRPLGAWGFDLTAKVGFDSPDMGAEEECEYIEEDKDEEEGDDEADDEDIDNEEDESDDEEGNGAKKPPSPMKASPVKKGVTKKATAKRKREDADGDKKTAPAAKKTAAAKPSEEKASSAPSSTKAPTKIPATPPAASATKKPDEK